MNASGRDRNRDRIEHRAAEDARRGSVAVWRMLSFVSFVDSLAAL
jgi:hypothetical protein